MAVHWSWFTDQEKPGIQIEYIDPATDTVVDLSGYTFTAELVRGTTIVASQTTNMTGAATSPNFTMSQWTSVLLGLIEADLTSLGVTSYNYEYRPYLRASGVDEVPTSQQPLTVQFKMKAA